MPKPDRDANRLGSIGRLLAEKVSPEPAALILLVVVAGVVVEVTSIRLGNALVAYLFLGLCVVTVAALVVVMLRRSESVREQDEADQHLGRPGKGAASTALRLTLMDRAEFSGGVDELTEVLLQWQISDSQDRIGVEHVVLTDKLWRVRHPDDYLRLRNTVRVFERSVNAALAVKYYPSGDMVEWHAACLVRLRDLVFLAPPPDGEHWFAWQVGSNRIVPFDIAQSDVRSIRSGYYEHPGGVGIRGLRSRPIWLVRIAPSEVWQWIIPAVVLAWITSGDDPANLRFHQWVFSDRQPSSLELPPNPEDAPERRWG